MKIEVHDNSIQISEMYSGSIKNGETIYGLCLRDSGVCIGYNDDWVLINTENIHKIVTFLKDLEDAENIK